MLARIANFAWLRRELGLVRIAALVADAAARVAALLPDARVTTPDRDVLEIALAGEDRAGIDRAIALVENAFQRPFAIDDEPYSVELLLGAAVSSARTCDPTRLVEEAERALEHARAEHRTIIRDVEASASAIDRVSLARDLHGAMARGELVLHYQPKVHVRRQEITSVEALIRWRHPVRGMVLPGDFIPLAEETRDIDALTIWTIRQVIEDQQRLCSHGHDMPIFINISGMLLSDPHFVRRACAMVRTSGVRIGFEITETSVIRDPQSAIANLKIFADIGIIVAIDDYGAGLSSLAYLKQLPARELKIDKLFITQLTSSNRDPLIVRSTIDLAHALEMEVVAEGVETPAALALLSVMGCDMVQGFLISRPIALDALLAFLEQDRGQTLAPARMTFGGLATSFQQRA